jgi:REP element-mobilizing transposase RayT
MEPRKHYHLYTHANGFENLFRREENFRYFLLRYQHFIEPVADTLAYCLMPNHIHFLIRVKTEVELEQAFGKFETFQKLEARVSKQFANLFSSYTQAFNKMYGRKGSLFIPNFKRKEIESDQYLTNIIHYIHANPVHHGFVKQIQDWKWSSYREIISDECTSWIKKDEITNWFGNMNELIKFHEQPVSLKKEMEID